MPPEELDPNAVEELSGDQGALDAVFTCAVQGALELLRRWAPRATDQLLGVVAQRLVPRVCEACQGNGCDACHGAGRRGRRAVFEIEPQHRA